MQKGGKNRFDRRLNTILSIKKQFLSIFNKAIRFLFGILLLGLKKIKI